MTVNVLIEAFGSIVNEEARKENVSLADALRVGLQEVDDLIGLDEVDAFITGMNADVTEALQEIVAEDDLDIGVEPFYPNVTDIMERDDIGYDAAWKQGFQWRNNCTFDADNEDTPTADLTVRIGDAGQNGGALLEESRQKGVPALDINIDSVVDKSVAYGDGDASSEADEGEAEA